MFHTEDPQTLSVIAQNSVAQATWRQGFLHSWSMLLMVIYCRKRVCYKEHIEALIVTRPHICLKVNTAKTSDMFMSRRHNARQNHSINN